MLDDRQEQARIDTRQLLTDEQMKTLEQNRLRAIWRKRERELKEQFKEQANRLKNPVQSEQFLVVHDNCDMLVDYDDED